MDRFLVMDALYKYGSECFVISYEHGVLIGKIK